MASLSTDKNGNRTIQFGKGNQRKTIRLGKVSLESATTAKGHVAKIVAARAMGDPIGNATAAWLKDLKPEIANKLAKVGLTKPKGSAALEAFIDGYVASRIDVKPGTLRLLKQTKGKLVEFFGAKRAMETITPGDCDEFRMGLAATMADNTVRTHCARARQIFQAAQRKRLLTENPFGDMKGCGVRANSSKFYFVTREQAASVLEACPSTQWRLLFALSRFGGLRCPSEHQALTWGDIDWANDRFRVRSPKTEHHEGHEERLVPIFPELRPYLDEAYHELPEGTPATERVITVAAGGNFRKQMKGIVERAGLTPWPKLFQNLRSTRETELADEYPIHVACAWIGNSQAVARKHYLQVTDDHFKQGAALQKALRHVAASGETQRSEIETSAVNPR